MVSKSELAIWIITLSVVTLSILDFTNINKDISTVINLPNKDFNLSSIESILVCPEREKSKLLSVLKEEIPKDKVPLLKGIEIKNGELYVILYNDITCRLGEIKDVGKKLDLALKIIEGARKREIKIGEIDVRSLKFPTIKEVDVR